MLQFSSQRQQTPQNLLAKMKSKLDIKLKQYKESQMSLYDKLQIYDRIVGQFKVSRYDPQVLQIFSHIIHQHANSVTCNQQPNRPKQPANQQHHSNIFNKNKAYSAGIFNSPTYNKNQIQDIEDPQLFSFSKTRKQSSNPNLHQINYRQEQIQTKNFQLQKKDRNKVMGNKLQDNQMIKRYKYFGKRNLQQNSDKPRYTLPRFTQPHDLDQNQRNVSQFNSQNLSSEDAKMEGKDKKNKLIHIMDNPKQYIGSKKSCSANQDSMIGSLHHLSKKLKLFLLTKNAGRLFKLISKQIAKRKTNLKKQSVKYLYSIGLLKKSFAAIKTFNTKTIQLVRDYHQCLKEKLLKQYFYQWYDYTSRPQVDKIMQKQIYNKQVFLSKKLTMMKLIRNSYIYRQQIQLRRQQDQNITLKSHLKTRRQVLKQKQFLLIKSLTISRLISNKLQKQKFKQKKIKLDKLVKSKQLNLFFKLTQCVKQVNGIRQQKLVNLCVYRNGCSRLLNNLKKQMWFMRGYWKYTPSKNIIKQCIDTSSPYIEQISQFDIENLSQYKKKQACRPINNIKQLNILNKNYQKILFIYQALDCVKHNLNRKGYKFLEQVSTLNEDQSQLQKVFKSHPAYTKYYKPYKTRKYFIALKSTLLIDPKIKIDKVKYSIIGKRVLYGGLFKWYNFQSNKYQIKSEIDSKYCQVKQLFEYKGVTQFYKFFESKVKIYKQQAKLRQFVKKQKIISSLMKLKTYYVSKNYYRKQILNSLKNKKMKLLESYFLEWKLHCAENVHYRLLQRDIESLRKSYVIYRLRQNMRNYGIQDKLQRKKTKNFRKIRLENCLNQVLKALRQNWKMNINYTIINNKPKLKSRGSQYVKNCHQLGLMVQKNGKQKFFSQLIENWYQYKLYGEIRTKIMVQYNLKLLRKVFLGLKVIKRVNKQEQQKLRIISNRMEQNTKRMVLGQFIKKMIMKIKIKRFVKIIRKNHLSQFFDIARYKTSADLLQEGQDNQLEVEN